MYLVYDTETTGLPKKWKAPISDSDNWPRCVQIAWQLHDKMGKLISFDNIIIKPEGYDIPFNASKIHGITTKIANDKGVPLIEAMEKFRSAIELSKFIIGHNIAFDQNIVGAELYRLGWDTALIDLPLLDTMTLSTEYCQLPGGRGSGFKPPKLTELHQVLFDVPFDEAHNASADVNATARCFFEVLRRGVVSPKDSGLTAEEFAEFKTNNPKPIESFDIKIEDQVKSFNEAKTTNKNFESKKEVLIDSPYFHFHNHTSFSILSATTQVRTLVDKAIEEEMPAVGMTDSGNLMGAFQFVNEVYRVNKDRQNPIVPIIGCELYVAEDYLRRQFTKDNPDRRFTQLLLAKNKNGYRNLSKLSSIGYIDGYYAGYPRISKELVAKYKENLVATTGSISGEVPNLILNVGEQQAEIAFQWWLEIFGDDYYVELIRHGLEEEDHVNEVLLQFAKKYDVKVIAQNNTYYLEQDDANAHDILLCVRDGEKKETPIGRGRDKRFGFPNNEFYFKSQQEMKSLFVDIPEAIENLSELLEKFEPYHLAQEVLLPAFDIPQEFVDPEDVKDGGKRGENAYLKHITYEGAKKRYPELTEEIKERLDFELATIANTGYPGYFLIVQDFTSQARKMGVSVGPGRGSAAGSAVAYCIGITNVDPIKYDLLFERFLNPDRVSLPDIDIDFDDRGRDKVIEWVVNKYGKDQVAQIITYGTMAGKSAIRDTGRVLALPLADTDRIAKKVHLKLNSLFSLDDKNLKEKVNGDQYTDSLEIKKIAEQNNLEATTIQQAKVIEGSIRNTGIHACGVIITPTNITDLVPMTVAKDAELLVTQFDNSVVEDAGLLKMDFLGLRTLTIIKDAVKLVAENHAVELDPDEFPLDDLKTYTDIFQKGRTTAVFQYESPGMQKHMVSLKPDKFDDLIAMNALYRPGPIAYIPSFIQRKHGIEEVAYDLPEMEEYLKDTYGITVYQEQVMLLSQKLANFSKGEADVLRKAMGKKKRDVLDKMKPDFIDRAKKNGHPEDKLEKIWTDWEAFAQYAFNKSHSTCYAYIAFQTAYLKAHYPAEFMAAVLSNNNKDISKLEFFLRECKRMGLKVKGPHVNDSLANFSVNKEGEIVVGMAALKNVGANAVEDIITERKEKGDFVDVFDFVKRVNYNSFNKKTFEGLLLSGAMDTFGLERSTYFTPTTDGKYDTFMEQLLKFGNAYQLNASQMSNSLFGSMEELQIQNPTPPKSEPWANMHQLKKEKEVVGVYVSGHPLDPFKYQLLHFTDAPLNKFDEIAANGRHIKLAGIITEAKHGISQKYGYGFARFKVQDFNGEQEFFVNKDIYHQNKGLIENGNVIHVEGHFKELSWGDNPAQMRFYPQKLSLLSTISEDRTKSITVYLPLMDISEDVLNGLDILCTEKQGEHKLFIKIKDDNDNILEFSTSKNIQVDGEFMDGLTQIGLKSKLN